MVKIGVLGAGHLGKIHLKCLQQTSFKLIGFYDPDKNLSTKVSEQFGLMCFESAEDLISNVDCVDIVAPTKDHYTLALLAIAAGKHIFIEKPVTETPQQALDLMNKAQSVGLKIQVGHVERYNPGYIALQSEFLNPRFIEGHRLAIFNPRGTDVSVVHDLMIHDLDMVLSIVKSEVKNIYANGVCVVSSTPDICNARIEFENGCIANLTASRISLKNMRKLRIFQENAYISIDFLNKEAQIVKIEDNLKNDDFEGVTIHTNSGIKRIIIESPPKKDNNAILEELNDFYLSVTENKTIAVGIDDGYKALKLAHEIHKCIQND